MNKKSKKSNRPQKVRVFGHIWIRNKYGSYTVNGDTSMEAQKNAMSYAQLLKFGGTSV